MTLDLNLPKLVLDPANEGDLTQLAYARIQTASGNTITDFRTGSAAAAFVEGQTFALAELLYYMNLMPEAIAIEVFRLYGVRRSLGTRATGALTFRLTDVAVDAFVLPIGYTIPYLGTQISITQSLSILPGGQDGTVTAIVGEVGTQYNANAFDILATNTGLGRVQSIYNRTQFTGGSDLETLDALVSRCQAATVSRRSVITQLDYEQSAQDTIGFGSRAVAVGNLSSDGATFRQNSVGVFLLDSTGKPASLTTCQLVASDLKTKILIGTGVFCFPALLVPINIEININVLALSDKVAEDVTESIKNYLRPNTYNGGQVVLHNEIAYRARLMPNVRSVDSLLINGLSIDYQLPQPWCYPVPDFITVNQIDSNGLTLTSLSSFNDEDYIGE